MRLNIRKILPFIILILFTAFNVAGILSENSDHERMVCCETEQTELMKMFVYPSAAVSLQFTGSQSAINSAHCDVNILTEYRIVTLPGSERMTDNPAVVMQDHRIMPPQRLIRTASLIPAFCLHDPPFLSQRLLC